MSISEQNLTLSLPPTKEKGAQRLVQVVYALLDPENPTIPRYIGETKYLATRLSKHICQAKHEHKTYKDIWINQLLAEGRKPIIMVFGEASATCHEAFYIKLYKSQGIILLNKTENGKQWGKRISLEEDAKIRAFLGLGFVQYSFNF